MKEHWNCQICNKEMYTEVQMCCSGHECGCRGMPIDPPVCSNECYDKFMGEVNEIQLKLCESTKKKDPQ